MRRIVLLILICSNLSLVAQDQILEIPYEGKIGFYLFNGSYGVIPLKNEFEDTPFEGMNVDRYQRFESTV